MTLYRMLMPIVYLVIMGNSFHGVLTNLSLAVVSQDHGLYGRRVVEQLQALQAGPKTFDLSYKNDPASAIGGARRAATRAHWSSRPTSAIASPRGASRRSGFSPTTSIRSHPTRSAARSKAAAP